MNDCQETKKALEKKLEQDLPVIRSLSKYGNVAIRNYKPLKINEKDIDIVFSVVKKEVEYIRKTLELNEGKDVLGVFFSFAFKALFLNDNSFKYDDLDKKIDIFDAILQYHKTLVTDDNIKKYEAELRKNIGKKEFKFFQDYIKSDILYFIYLVLRSFQASSLILNEYIIRFVEIYSVSVIHFRYEELENISHNEIIDKIYELLFQKNINNNFHLYIEEGHLKIIEFICDELLNYINQDNSKRIIDKKQKKANKKKKKEKTKNVPINEKKKEEDTNLFDKKCELQAKQENKCELITKQENRTEISTEQEKKCETSTKQEKIINIDNEVNKANAMNLNDKQLPMIMEKFQILEKEINYLKECNEEKDKKINHLEECNEEKDEKIKVLNEQIYSLNQDVKTQNIDILRMQSDLKLIQFCRAFKCFVNYIYYSLYFSDELPYEEKIEVIIKQLDEFISVEFNQTLIQSTIGFLNKLSGLIKKGNYKAHHLDLNVSVIDQIFEFIDKKKEHKDLQEMLKTKCNMDIILKKLILNEENNYKNNRNKYFGENSIINEINGAYKLWKY